MLLCHSHIELTLIEVEVDPGQPENCSAKKINTDNVKSASEAKVEVETRVGLGWTVEVEPKTTRVEVETESSCDIPENCSKVMISDCFGSATMIKSAEEIDNVGAAKDSGIERQFENKTFERNSL